MVETDGLEIRKGCKVFGGSNPSPSASQKKPSEIINYISARKFSCNGWHGKSIISNKKSNGTQR